METSSRVLFIDRAAGPRGAQLRGSEALRILVLISVFGPTLVGAAEVSLPPSQFLTKAEHRIALLRVAALEAPDAVAWRRVEEIQGELPKRFSSRASSELVVELETGVEYLVVASNRRRNPLFREGVEQDPEGWRVVEVPGVGPAVFPDHPALRDLIQSGDELPGSSRGDLGQVQDLLASGHDRLVALAVAELSLRPDLQLLADEETIESLRLLLESGVRSLEVRTMVLVTLGRVSTRLPISWLAAAARKELSAGPVVDLSTFEPALVEAGLGILAAAGRPEDGAVAVEYLASNSPGVVKAAIAAARRTDCRCAQQRAAELLKSDDLHRESRRALQDLVRERCG